MLGVVVNIMLEMHNNIMYLQSCESQLSKGHLEVKSVNSYTRHVGTALAA